MATAPDDIDRLIARTAKGDRKAFGHLYLQTKSKLFGIVLRIVKDRARAEEVLQEAYLRVWRNAQKYESSAGRPIPWMAAIAHNAAIDEVRRAGSGRTLSLDEDGAVPELMDPLVAADAVEMKALQDCLAALDPEHRRCVLLAYYEGYSREELSEVFDRPVGTIKSWLHRALSTLQTCLGIT